MPDPSPVPLEAVTAAAEAIHRESHEGRPCNIGPMPWHVRAATAAVGAAAPAIRADERERTRHVIKRIEGLAEACQRKAIDNAVKTERDRLKPVLDAYFTLWDAVWNKTATCEGDRDGYNVISYGDCSLIEEAAEAVEAELLAAGLIGAQEPDPQPGGAGNA